jgi:hypothetical protein
MRLLLLCASLVASSAALAQREGDPGTEAWIANTHAGVQLVNIECAENLFDPPQIVVRVNVPVRLSVRTTGGRLQFLNQSFLPGNAPIGKVPSLLTFVPTVAGQYEISCQPASGATAPPRKGMLIVR